MRGSGQVALCFFGDGATNQGGFHEIANLAAIWKLPLILVCENNRFAMSARVENMVAVKDLAERARAYGFPGVSVDGMDVIAVRDAVAEARQRAVRGEGPTLVVASCYRFAGHFSGDTQRYRTKEELQPWLDRDPVARYEERLIGSGVLTEEAAEELKLEVRQALDGALEFAVASPFPEPEQAFEDVLA
jgi:TPP-dependent pyruvate/acetoin dehydrogenase alpha subunit